MRVLIVSTNRHRQPVPALPLGACVVAEAAAAAGHSVRFLDLMFAKNPFERLERALRVPVDVVGLSVRNIDNNDAAHPVAFYRELRPVVQMIRRHTPAAVVLGGAAVHVMPEELLRFSGADRAVIGPGEMIFPALLSASMTERIPGTAGIADGRFWHCVRKDPPPAPPVAPDLSRWTDLSSYLREFASVPLQTKRGCPFACIYCTYPLSEGTGYRLSDPERVAGSIAGYAAQGIRDIEFVDNVFNAPYGHALAVCEAVRRRRCGVRLHSVDLSPGFLDERLLAAMEEAGFASLGITVESAADAVLRRLRKPFSRSELLCAARAVRRHRLPCMWVFLLGGPGETASTVEETLHFAASAARPQDTVFFNIGIRVYPGTALHALAVREGQITMPPSEMLEPVMYFSAAADRLRIAAMVREASRRQANFITPENWNIPCLNMLYRIGYRMGMRNPVWRYTGILRRSIRLMGVNP